MPVGANLPPAFGCYLAHSNEPTAHPIGILVLTPFHDRIMGITRFLDPDLPRLFGLEHAVEL